MPHPFVRFGGLVLVLVVLGITAVVVSRPAFRQPVDKVVIREPGQRFLGALQPAGAEAEEDLDFALLSQAAYGDMPAENGKGCDHCLDAMALLRATGWERWPDFPSTTLDTTMNDVHLRAEVWFNRPKAIVVVAFGGTVFSNWKDWRANLRWFNPFRNDEYSVTVNQFAPQFAEEFSRKEADPNWQFLRTASIYSTGHSLGGGLAEEFAYSFPAAQYGIPKVAKVYAFDPSPVSGFLSVKRGTRNENKDGLKIDRIYERGEILAIARSLTSAIHKPPAANPEIRQVRYNLFGDDRFGITNSISGHSIQHLAFGLSQVAHKPPRVQVPPEGSAGGR